MIVTAVFGILGYLMIRFDYPRLTVVIALVLGNTAERSFRQSMAMSDGDWSIFVHRGTSLVIIASIALTLALPLLRVLVRRARSPA